MSAGYSLSAATCGRSETAPLDGVWIFCIASYDCSADGFPSRRAVDGLFQSGIAVPALGPWGGPVPASEPKGESHTRCPSIETARQIIAIAIATAGGFLARPPYRQRIRLTGRRNGNNRAIEADMAAANGEPARSSKEGA